MDGMNANFYMLVCVLHSEIWLWNKVLTDCLLFEKYRMDSLLDNHYDVGHRSYAMAVLNKVIFLLTLVYLNYEDSWLCVTKLFIFICRSFHP
jgi:hypothetical protein